MKKTATPLLLVLIAALLLSSCIQTPDPQIPNRINFLLDVEHVGPAITVGSDSVVVTEVKFFTDKVNLTLADGATLQTNVEGLVMAYRESFEGDYETILAANIGFEDIDAFNSMTYFIGPPGENSTIQDADFFGDETNYSFVITGKYNDQLFTYQANVTFDKGFPFNGTITLDDEKETLVLRTSYDVRDILISPEGELLDPRDDQNRSVINAQFKEALSVEASAEDIY